MTYSRPLLAVTLSIALTACASGGGQEPPAPASTTTAPAPTTTQPASTSAAPATTATAVASFSEAQADRGRDIFRASCTECHYSSEFSDSQFQFKWSRRTAGSLFQLIQTSMPETAPGSLTDGEAVDIVSYILRMNGFEPGDAELAAERAVLDGISLASIRNQ